MILQLYVIVIALLIYDISWGVVELAIRLETNRLFLHRINYEFLV